MRRLAELEQGRPLLPAKAIAAGGLTLAKMSEKTKIQWCDGTVNPAMGCDGCELWPAIPRLVSTLVKTILQKHDAERPEIVRVVQAVLDSHETATHVWLARKDIVAELEARFPLATSTCMLQAIEKLYVCYAGAMHMRYGASSKDWSRSANPGFAPIFDKPMKRPGEMVKAAGWSDLSGKARTHSPWLDGLPRLNFVSDMADALSSSIPFDYLKSEIIDVVTGDQGSRHLWLWLTKRPKRMAEFAHWLQTEYGVDWPENLVAMTSVTNRATRSRLDELRQVPAKFRGLSVEPLVEQVDLDLTGIDWVIVGGESGKYAREFDIEWARSLQRQCREADVAFFVKQLGALATEDGFSVPLTDGHGGDWDEWPSDLRVREFPAGFHQKMS